MLVMSGAWIAFRSRRQQTASAIDPDAVDDENQSPDRETRMRIANHPLLSRFHDLVDISSVDLYKDEYVEPGDGGSMSEDLMRKRLDGRWGVLWKIFYLLV